MNRLRLTLEAIIANSRWFLAPFLLGLILTLAALLFNFALKLFDFFTSARMSDPSEIIVGSLKLVDIALTANLIVIVICSSYENFLAPIDVQQRPAWPTSLANVGFSGLKQRLLASIVAIAAVNVLEWFLDIENSADSTKLGWLIAIMLGFALTMLLMAIADRVGEAEPPKH
ncbi:uncharacterized protein (TIGR00645 family) [Bosea sp. OAE752]|jgi:uncharacterized protein (TIGR00645 family)|uniref:UPF0114 protein IED13_05490 n=1 Tax=Bosea spartocytisi TaxID=2773451 RepID=A0A927HX81_9HYPH|nr:MULTISPECIES: YqhA family protein [Bosea]MBD3845140.1 YqhA family protein [Bosea spartocytisi]MCT4472309.1 YqhA family protein [Bosea spartocytisi]